MSEGQPALLRVIIAGILFAIGSSTFLHNHRTAVIGLRCCNSSGRNPCFKLSKPDIANDPTERLRQHLPQRQIIPRAQF
uniref:Putative yip1 domain family member 5 n=1 Tax=Ixodes ricinus TaxID=34613 RepID=A0A0K8RK65_IXORI